MQKKLVSLIILSLLMAVVLVGCGGSQTKDTTDNSSDTQESENSGGATFQEFPIGDPVEVEGMSIGAIYLQPVDMEPVMKAGLSAAESDIHLEADIVALKDNPYGFGFGEFVSYLTVKYEIYDETDNMVLSGSFMPMNAGDGSHYGANVKMPGAGNFTLKFLIDSPEHHDFLLHTDDVTGVPGRFWKKPIELEFDFPYVPRKF